MRVKGDFDSSWFYRSIKNKLSTFNLAPHRKTQEYLEYDAAGRQQPYENDRAIMRQEEELEKLGLL